MHHFLINVIEPLSPKPHDVGLTEKPGLDNEGLVSPDIFSWAPDHEVSGGQCG